VGDQQHKAGLYEQFARVGKAMASPKRLELLDLLAQGQRSVEDLACEAGLGLSTCSAHLQVLHHARLVSTRKQGTRVFYSLASDGRRPPCTPGYVTSPPPCWPRSRQQETPTSANRWKKSPARNCCAGPAPATSPSWTCGPLAPNTPPGTYPARSSIPISQLAQRLAELPPRHRESSPTAAAPTASSPTTPSACLRARRPHRPPAHRRDARMAPRRPARQHQRRRPGHLHMTRARTRRWCRPAPIVMTPGSSGLTAGPAGPGALHGSRDQA